MMTIIYFLLSQMVSPPVELPLSRSLLTSLRPSKGHLVSFVIKRRIMVAGPLKHVNGITHTTPNLRLVTGCVSGRRDRR